MAAPADEVDEQSPQSGDAGLSSDTTETEDSSDDASTGDASTDDAEGRAASASESADNIEPDGGDGESDPKSRKGFFGFLRQTKVAVPIMLVLTLIFGGLGYWFHSEAYSLRNEGAAANNAFVDQALTSKVKGQMTEAVEKLFSYDYANPAKTEKVANKLLTGEAVKQYNKLFDLVKKKAPKQKLVLTTTVQAASVTWLQNDRAQVLIFASQQVTSVKKGESNGALATLTVTAEKHGDQWKISQITPH